MNTQDEVITKTSSIPDISELGIVESNYHEINSQKSVSGDAFTRGNITFEWSISTTQRWSPKRSYMVLDFKITDKDGNALEASDGNFAIAEGMANNLFQNCYLYLGNSDISSCASYIGEAAMLRDRVKKSKSWQDSVGQAHWMIPDFTTRLSKTKEGTIFQCIFQPPIGIFETTAALGAGSYRLSLMPKGDPKLFSGLEMLEGQTFDPSTADIKLQVEDLKFNLCVFRTPLDTSNSRYFLELQEQQIQSKKLAPKGQQSFQFTVPSSTTGIAIFTGDVETGYNPLAPASRFYSIDKSTNNIANLQLSFGNLNKPASDYGSEYLPKSNQLYARYMDTYSNAELAQDVSCESYDDYIKRGPYYYWSFIRPSTDRSTVLQVRIRFGKDIPADTNLYVCAFYRTSCAVDVSDGFITNITRLNL